MNEIRSLHRRDKRDSPGGPVIKTAFQCRGAEILHV